jgi:hypothetical protein
MEKIQKTSNRTTRIKRRRRQRNTPQMQLSNSLNLYNNATGAVINILYPATIYAYTTSSNFSFASGSDVRYLAFSTVISSTFPFTNYATVYGEYKIISATAIVNPVQTDQLTGKSFGMLHLACDPEASSGSNPSNSVLIGSQNTHLFSYKATSPRIVNFRFPGIGNKQHNWLPVTEQPPGYFYIGSGITNTFGADDALFEASLSVQVMFRSVKNH